MAPQHDGVIANASGAAVRQDINNALAALITNSSGATEPGTTYAFQFWFDTTNNILKIRNAANSAWIDWITTTATALLPDGTVGAPGLTFASETDSGLYRIAANTLGIATSGTERVEISDTGIIINEGGDDADVRIEGNSDANLVFIDAGNDRVGIGTASPGALLDLGTSTPVLRFSDTDTTGYHQIQSSNANFIINADPSNQTASSAISFKVDNSEAARIDSAGNVGINTTAPFSTNGTNLEVLHDNSSGASRLILNNTDSSGLRYYIQSQNDGALSFGDFANSEAMRLDSAGRLLVGTSSTSADCNSVFVGSSTSATSIIHLGRSSSVSNGSALGAVAFGDNSQNTYAQISANADAVPGASDYPGRLTFSTTADGASSPTARMVIDSSGNVGIGTTSPQRNVHFNSSTTEVALKLTNSTSGSASGDGTDIKYEGLNLSINNREDGVITFETANTERMRIRNSGGLLVNTTTTTINSSNFGTRIGGSSTSIGVLVTSRNVGSGGEVAIFYGQSGELRVKGDGDCENTNNRYTGISDVKLKENIVDASSQWEDIKALQVRNYNFKEETGYGTHTQIGLVAQEVETVCPGLVGETNDTDDELNETGTVTKSVAYSVLYMKAVKALQEAMDRIETLEAKVAALEAG